MAATGVLACPEKEAALLPSTRSSMEPSELKTFHDLPGRFRMRPRPRGPLTPSGQALIGGPAMHLTEDSFCRGSA
ncbi:hypothetical protein E4U46_003589 [Claviceps purpurea]|nr:hypothetical protein E4U46_003589 [Claviceps purpurea]